MPPLHDYLSPPARYAQLLLWHAASTSDRHGWWKCLEMEGTFSALFWKLAAVYTLADLQEGYLFDLTIS